LGCSGGSVTKNPTEWGAERSFQTWLSTTQTDNYKPSYEGLGRVMCYNKIGYSADRKSATVEATCRFHSSVVKKEFNWDNQGYQENVATFSVDSSRSEALELSVKVTDGEGTEFEIKLEPVNFVW